MYHNLPSPFECLKETGPAPFLTKTYNIVEDSSTNNIVSWSRDNNSFIVWEPDTFALICLPRSFKHTNFSSFVRQRSILMCVCGFKKIDTERWEFAKEYFLRGHRHLLKNIRRRKTTSQTQTQTQSLEEGRFELEGEIQGLRKERVALVVELMRLRRKHESVKTYLHLMEEKLKLTEKKQEMMMDFLLKKIKKPTSMEDQRQDGVELEMDSEGIWKGFVLSDEMCDLGEHLM
ncbi:Heat stress transcription factor A-6a [Cardamine amara subsp. amara]|uniref:Heat stress transcription factor A-6a n=1 Tax=Cardamine amara subsp. amara TaxID=228776 RepID=A0ABD0ZYP2_CARAN